MSSKFYGRVDALSSSTIVTTLFITAITFRNSTVSMVRRWEHKAKVTNTRLTGSQLSGIRKLSFAGIAAGKSLPTFPDCVGRVICKGRTMASSSSGFYVGGHRFSYKEASALAAQPDTCLEIVDSHVDLMIPMARISQLGDGIKEALNMQLNHTVESLDGVLIAYQRLRLHSPSLDLSEYMSEMQEVRVFGTFIVFRPKPGKRLKGIVTRVNQHHVGCLVHQIFATTLRSSSSSNISFDGLYNQGDEVTFEVVAMDIHRGIPSVRGCLTDELILSHRGTASSLVPPAPSAFLTDTLAVFEPESTSHKKKKKKKRSGEDEASSTPTDSGISTTTDVTEDTFSTVDFTTPEPSRKSKKRKRESSLASEDVVDLPQSSGMDISFATETSEESVKKKKKKKRRHEEDEDILTAQPEDVEMTEAPTQEVEAEPEISSSKKKKKKRHSELLET